MALEYLLKRRVVDLPDNDRIQEIARANLVPVVRIDRVRDPEMLRIELGLFVLQNSLALVGLNVPDPDGVVLRGGAQVIAIMGVIQAPHEVLMPVQRGDGLSGFQVPNVDQLSQASTLMFEKANVFPLGDICTE